MIPPALQEAAGPYEPFSDGIVMYVMDFTFWWEHV